MKLNNTAAVLTMVQGIIARAYADASVKRHYSVESLRKYSLQMKAAIDQHMNGAEDIKLCISAGNRKIGRVLNVSLPALFTCGFACQVCVGDCYDIKAALQYGNVLDARARNYALLVKNRDAYFAAIDERMNRRRVNKYFRWHVSGDIVDYDYFSRMVDNARRHPDFIIWTYTKQYFIVNRYVKEHGGSIKAALPSNLSIMFSDWRGLDMLNPYGFATFGVIFDDDADDVKAEKYSHHICPGNCDACKPGNAGCLGNHTTNAIYHN